MGRSNERKGQLLTIMRVHRERGTSVSEFSRTAVAHEAGVTPQYLSMLIGPEFHAAAQGCLECVGPQKRLWCKRSRTTSGCAENWSTFGSSSMILLGRASTKHFA
jgi:hypothetical protein